MTPSITSVALSVHGQPVDRLPAASGVYRFFDADHALLYVGKSIDVHARVASHFNDGQRPGRQQRIMLSVRRIDCELTAGEIGALLQENAAIKAETPLYNRRQRRARRLWTIALEMTGDGFLRVQPVNFSPSGLREQDVFGLYHGIEHIESSIRRHARDHRLCLRKLGYDRGRGPCFQHQIKRCAGACVGAESPEAHNRRLLVALERERIAAWPFGQPVLIREQCAAPVTAQPRTQWHAVDQWAWLGSFRRRPSAVAALKRAGRPEFDRDAYRILLNAIGRGEVGVFDPDTGAPLLNPLAPRSRSA